MGNIYTYIKWRGDLDFFECPFYEVNINDIYTIADALLRQDDITLVTRKDYIAAPKPNGYRSLHLLVKVPVFFAEHNPDQRNVVMQLKCCAELINATDEKMLLLRQQVEMAADDPTEEELLLEKLEKLDIKFD